MKIHIYLTIPGCSKSTCFYFFSSGTNKVI